MCSVGTSLLVAKETCLFEANYAAELVLG